MKNRREFIASAVTVAGSLFLTPCAGTSSGVGNLAMKLASVKNANGPSPDGSAIPPLSFIDDSENGLWTVVDGVVKLNGENAGFTEKVILLVYYGEKIYQQNEDGNWWSWTNSTWVSVARDPRNISSNGTVCPPATRIVDSAKNVWVVSGGVVLKNGANAAFTEQVTLLVHYKGVIYQQNSDGKWWAWNGGDWISMTGDPRPLKNQLFYGINSHYPRGESAYGSVAVGTQLRQMMNLGARTIRVGVTTDSEIARMRSLLQALVGTGMQAYPCLDVYLKKDANTSPFAYSEPYYYDIGFSTGARVANGLKGLVKYYEIGNEIDSQALISAPVDGNSPTDYDNQWFILARGLVRGLADGVKSVDTSAAIIGPACSWLHLAFLDLLWNGVQPNGGTGNPLVRWDIESWHWYSDMGNILSASGGSGTHNVLSELQAARGLPIWLTEFGVRPYANGIPGVASTPTETQMSDWLLDHGFNRGGYPTLIGVAPRYGVQNIMLFEHYDDAYDGRYGVVGSDGASVKERYSRLQQFFAAHPVESIFP